MFATFIVGGKALLFKDLKSIARLSELDLIIFIGIIFLQVILFFTETRNINFRTRESPS